MAQHHALRERLVDNRRSRREQPSGHKYLLNSGITICGLCGRWLQSAWRTNAGRVYSCVSSVDKDGCGRLTIVATPLEQHVVDAVFDHVGRDQLPRMIANPDAWRRELQRRTAIEARMLDLAALYAEHKITRAEWHVARLSLARQLRRIPADPAHLGGLTLGDPHRLLVEWNQLQVDRRRAMLQLIIDVVIINPAVTRGPRLDARRIDIRWR